ncbi:hypothetical protein [Planctomicrobium sp. SH664]|uniref:hypothetical protein n=1 Tax=Planctomicrobium sp. SH664 TaxID=3448125 RepID=UPI003F5B717F
MKSAARAFADQRREEIFGNRPQSLLQPAAPPPTPWQSIRSGEMPPLMFQLRFRTGETISYAYSDLREIRVRDAGRVQLGIQGLSKLLITIEGRHLRDLGELIGSGLLRWLQETDERTIDIPEESPCITAIMIEKLTGR